LLSTRNINSNKSLVVEVQNEIANESRWRKGVESSNRVSGIGIQHETGCRVTKIITDVYSLTMYNRRRATASLATAIVVPQLVTGYGIK